MKSGWFEISGSQTGERTLAEQIQGLDWLRAGVRGKTVLDLGCAEGLITAQMANWGAAAAHGVEINPEFVDAACGRYGDAPRVKFGRADLNSGLPVWLLQKYDVVLCLAILHKLSDPGESLNLIAPLCDDRLIIRLPLGSKGVFRSKFTQKKCDANAIMREHRFTCDTTLPGPRGELVQHWLRP